MNPESRCFGSETREPGISASYHLGGLTCHQNILVVWKINREKIHANSGRNRFKWSGGKKISLFVNTSHPKSWGLVSQKNGGMKFLPIDLSYHQDIVVAFKCTWVVSTILSCRSHVSILCAKKEFWLLRYWILIIELLKCKGVLLYTLVRPCEIF